MALVPHKITALAESDAQGTDGKNIVAGAVVSLYDTTGTAVTLFDDAAGTNGSTAKTTDATGQVVVWVTPGEYDEEVNASIQRRVTVGGNSPIELPTFSSLAELRPTKTGQAFICQERANAKYILQASGYTALPGDVTFANGRVGALQVDGEVNILWFGVKNDGTDSTGEIREAGSRSRSLYFPDGNYLFAVPIGQGNIFTPLDGAKLWGNKRNAKITIQINDSTFKNLIPFVNDGLEFNGLSITIENNVNQDCRLIQCLANDLKLIDCYINGGVTDDGLTPSYDGNLIALPSTGTQEGVLVKDCEITQFIRTQIKTNTSTSIQRDNKWINNWCHNNYVSDVGGFNTPNGIIEDVLIEGNRVTDGRGEAIGTLHIPFGGASPKNVRIINNYCSGLYAQIVHIEEAMDNVVIANNTFECDVSSSAGSVINVLEANVGGTLDKPERVVISNNTIKKQGIQKEAGTIGIWVTLDADEDTAGEHIIISNNVINGFATGIAAESDYSDAIKISNNSAKECTTGFVFDNAYAVNDNFSIECNLGLKVTQGGQVLGHKFIGNVDNVDSDNVPFSLINSEFYFDSVSVVAGGTEFIPLVNFNLDSRCNIVAVGNAYNQTNNSAHSNVQSTVVWDGSAETITGQYALQPGSVQTSFSNDGGVFSYGVFSASAVDVKGTVFLDGSFLIGN